MTKTFLIATVAALAITVPAQAQRGDKDREQRAEQAQKAEKAQAQGGEQRAERPQRAQAQGREQRANRSVERRSVERDRPQAQNLERRERASFNRERASSNRLRAQERVVERRARAPEPRIQTRQIEARQQQNERRASRQQDVSNRRAIQQQAQSERRGRSQQIESDRRSRIEQAQSDRRARGQQVESDRRSRIEQAQSDRRSRNQQLESDRRSRIEQAQSDRRSRLQQLDSDRRSTIQQAESFAGVQQPAFERRLNQQALATQNWQTFTSRVASFDDDDRDVRFVRVGERWDPDWYDDDYVPWGYSNLYYDTPDYYYRYDYDDGYLYRVRRDNNLVLALIPLLGGAYSVGQPLPFYYQSYYNVPLGYSTLYYDTPDYYYRYGGGAIYQVDPATQLIAGIVALLTGQSLGIGQMLPLGYDTYNVPYAYRSTYFDTDDMWYRYDDGYIYGVDPYTRLIETSYPAYGGYAVGYPVPFGYAGYDYNVPYAYRDLYYDAPGYNYHLASGGIYQIDPATQVVAALVALVTGQNFGVGQRLPLGYDVYNVPLGYRDAYYDSDRYMYRYADGYIYQIDPRTRVIGRVIDV